MPDAPHPPPPIHLGVLGPIEVIAGDRPVTIRRRRQLGILVRLAFGPARRSELAQLFWGHAASNTLASLRTDLSGLRGLLGSDAFAEGPEGMRLAEGRWAPDVAGLESALRDGDVSRLLQLWRGPFLGGDFLRDAPAFDDWAEGVRGRLEAQVGDALLLAAAAAAERADTGRAEGLYAKATEVAPHRLEGWLRRVRCALDAGRTNAAAAVLAEARAFHSRSGELQSLAEALEHAARESVWVATSGPAIAFVGREAELARLHRVWRAALRGRAVFAEVAGPSGIGKTRLVQEFGRAVSSRGHGVASAACHGGDQTVPFGLVTELVRSLLRLPGAAGTNPGAYAVVSSLLPSSARTVGEAVPVAGPEVAPLADALRDLIQAIVDEAPLLVMLDDLHWADEKSLTVIRRAVRGVAGGALMVLTSHRGGVDRGRVGLSADDRITLPPLRIDEVEELLWSAGREPTPEAAERLLAVVWTQSRGHPLFLQQLLAELAGRAVLVRGGDAWEYRLEGVDLPRLVPATARELIRRRLGGLSSDAWRLLRAMRPGPRGTPWVAVRQRLGRDGAEATRALAEVTDGRLVEVDEVGNLHYLHAVIAELCRAPTKPASPAARWIAAVAASLVVGWVAAGASWFDEAPAPWWQRVEGVVRWVAVGDSVARELRLGPAVVAPRLETAPLGLDPHFQVSDVRRGLDGHVVWAGARVSLDATPDAAVDRGGGTEVIRRWPGDSNAGRLSPAGDRVLLLEQRTDLDAYALSLRVMDLGTGETRTLYEGGFLQGASWSADGAEVGFVAHGVPDTLVTVGLDGAVRSKWPVRDWARVKGGELCGGGGQVLAGGERGGLQVMGVFDLESKSSRVLRRREPRTTPPRCLGGGLAAFSTWSGSGQRAVVLDVVRDTVVFSAPLGRGPRPHEALWTPAPDTYPPSARSLRLEADGAETLEWGGTLPVTPVVRWSDGRESSPEVEWTVSDPAVAHVDDSGSVFGVGEGKTHVTARFGGWLVDSLAVVVGAAPPPSLLVNETWGAGWERRWRIEGEPRPETRDDARFGRLLRLTGDGRYADWLLSERVFGLEKGATLETWLRLWPLRRRDRQQIELCLIGGPADVQTPVPGVSGSEEVCFRYPSAEAARFRIEEGLVRIASKGVVYRIDLAGRMPARDWVPVSLVVAPGGVVTLHVAEELVARVPLAASVASAEWRLLIHHKALETELALGPIRLWEGVRVGR